MMVPNLPQFKASDIDILNFERVNAFGDSILYRSGASESFSFPITTNHTVTPIALR